MTMEFRNAIGKNVFDHKYRYREGSCGTWEELSNTLVHRICDEYMTKKDISTLIKYVNSMKFIPGGRYLYYAGRDALFVNNCFTFIAEDSREGWADLAKKHFLALMSGGGIGTFYGKVRAKGNSISRTGGESSGPLSLMKAMNEIGRNVRQGGSRRSALWAGLSWDHGDIQDFLYAKNWDEDTVLMKEKNFDNPAPLDMTNISVCYNTAWLESSDDKVFNQNVYQACKTSEPGFAFNFYENECDLARNACCEVTSMFDSDVCNLGSVNMSRIDSLDEFQDVCRLGNMFLICGTMKAELPYEKVALVREMSRKIGLGLTGVHEWLIKRNYRYEFNAELHEWMSSYKDSKYDADKFISFLGITPLQKYRAVAPAGTLSILAGTTSGIEPIYSKGTKRRYLQGDSWISEVYVDPTVKYLVENHNIDHNIIETSMDLSKDVERRIKFQADLQDYVDMGISSTINIPKWGSEFNNEDTVKDISSLIRKYAKRLRGLTFYADESRGGQPLEQISYEDAVIQEGKKNLDAQINFMETTSCKSGVCGI